MKIREKIKNFCLDYRSHKLAKKKREKKFKNFSEAKNIGIILSINNLEEYEILKKFIHTLEKSGKKVHTINYINNANLDYESFKLFSTILSFKFDDISILGGDKNDVLGKFMNNSYDYLYFTTFEQSSILKYLLARATSKCKVGYFEDSNIKFLDLMVNFDLKQDISDMATLTEQMLQYSQIFSNESVQS